MEVVESALLVVRLSLAFFLLSSGARKLLAYSRFIRGVADYEILPERPARLVGYVLPWLELMLGLALAVGILLPLALTASVVLLIGFSAAVLVNLLRGREINCNCFAIAETTHASWGTIGRNSTLLALGLAGIAVAGQAGRPSSFLTPWADGSTLAPAGAMLLTALMFAWSVALVYLVEWGIDDLVRGSELRQITRGGYR